jgi:hypothetical protein
MCLMVENQITGMKLNKVEPNHVFRFYKRFQIEGFVTEKLITPYRGIEIKTRIVKINDPLKRTTKLNIINGRALHLYYTSYEYDKKCNILIPVKVLAKHVIKFGTDEEVCVSQYEIPKKYAKRFNLKG